MQLSRKTLKNISPDNGLIIPNENIFTLPEKVLQFGTGVLLRGLPDYVIDKANRQGIFNGRIVIIKSTASAGADAFDTQDGLYTLCVKGIENGHTIDKKIIHSAVSRVLPAASQWQDILQCAGNPDIQVVISNTTEVGIVLDADDDIRAVPPRSFPAKLLAFLYKRYQIFNGDPAKGMVILPTELITDNGKKLEAIIEELARRNNLEHAFVDWLKHANIFCNSLVDRIVPGKLPAAMQAKTEAETGYTDELMMTSEVYCLWAIESRDKRVHDVLSFSKADEGVIITADIELFRELKIRLLNGTHTFGCGLAWLAGLRTVSEAMNNNDFSAFLSQLMKQEICPSITNSGLNSSVAKEFSEKVLDRFRNPHIGHQWLSITMQFSFKMKMRNIPVIQNYLTRFNDVPECITLAFAAHLLFMKCKQAIDGKYYGEVNGEKYLVNDDNAAWYAVKWQQDGDIPGLTQNFLGDETFWGFNFEAHPGFINATSTKLQELIKGGAGAAIKKFSQSVKPVVIL